MKTFAVTIGLVCLCTPAWSQAVTLADLQGSVITISAVHQEKIIRNGQPMNIQLTTTGRVTISSDKSISSQFQSTSTNQDTGRTREGQAVTSSGALDSPSQGTAGNDILWTFINGSLVRLRVFSGGAGAQKMAINFRRTGSGISCSYSDPMAREVGVGRIHKGSAVDNTSKFWSTDW